MKKIFIIKLIDHNTRIDKWLKRNFSSLTQSFIEKNLRKGIILANNKKIKSNYRILTNDKILITNFTDKSYKNILKKSKNKNIPIKILEKFNSSILYEDSNFLILNKWNGLATQGGSNINISVDDIIKHISKNYNLVHRLDKETSGLLIIAKNLEYTKIFGRLFKEKLIKKLYLAICCGSPKYYNSEIKLSIKDKKDQNRLKESITKYKVLAKKNNISYLVFNPLTGKTHQLRIVSKHLGCPIVGDIKYNTQIKLKDEKLKLNSYCLEFSINKKNYKFLSSLPIDFLDFLKKNKLSNKKNDIINF